ncbi:transmembrane proteins 14C-domain-containing protein [Scenedesmus sp. NREL 46B-D3]|nr:transmembrane proteins 14C-domain-containing protein [Scenedesmus sp. NREL 46B-D3]
MAAMLAGSSCITAGYCSRSTLLRPVAGVLRPCTAAAVVCRPAQSALHALKPRQNSWVVSAASFGGSGSSGSSGGSGGGGGASGGSSSGDAGSPHRMRPWTLAYALLLAAGGVVAYVKKGSAKSLTSAGGAALILALSARTMAGPQAKGSIAVCLAIALLLSVIMCGRYSRTRKVMPAGMTAGVSLAMSAAYLGSLFG